ncbi:MAG: hypothetical protein WBA89_20780 [Microcoleus sp.]
MRSIAGNVDLTLCQEAATQSDCFSALGDRIRSGEWRYFVRGETFPSYS